MMGVHYQVGIAARFFGQLLGVATAQSVVNDCRYRGSSEQLLVYERSAMQRLLPFAARMPDTSSASKPTFTTLEKDLAQGQHHTFLCGGSLVTVQQSWPLRADAEILSS